MQGVDYSWLDYLRAFTPVAIFALPVIMAGGFAWLKWALVTRREHDELEGKVDGYEERARGVRERIAILERLEQSSELAHRISLLFERIGQVETSQVALERQLESGLRSLERQAATTNTYMQTIIDKGLSRD